MRLKILLFIFTAIIYTSCSTTYRNGQTPDDVYFSPVKPVSDEVKKEQDKSKETNDVRRGYRNRQMVMCIHDRRWRDFDDDYNAYYDPYRFGYNCGYYYNPYYYPSPVYISGSVFTNPKNTTPRMTNLGSYNYSNMVVVNQKTGSTSLIRSTRPYNNKNTDNNFIRRIIVPSTNTNYNRSSDNDTRTYTPTNNNSSNSSSGSSSSGSSGAPVSRPHRGG